MSTRIRAIALVLLLLPLQAALAQPGFTYGFGAGINYSSITEQAAYRLFEDISGLSNDSYYSDLFANRGNQYFFHGELEISELVLAFKPGTYSYVFSKTDVIQFNTTTIEESTSSLLRYFNIPLQAKYKIGNYKLQPFVGGEIAYGILMQQSGNENQSLIRSRFHGGPSAGAYYALDNFDLVLDVSYHIGLHNITNRADRFRTGTITPQSQSDIKLNDLNVSLSVLFSLASDQKDAKGALDCPNFNTKGMRRQRNK